MDIVGCWAVSYSNRDCYLLFCSRFCGRNESRMLLSTGNIVIVRFNGYSQGFFGRGFKAMVTVVPLSSDVSIIYPDVFAGRPMLIKITMPLLPIK